MNKQLFNFDLRKALIDKFSEQTMNEENISLKEAQTKTLKFLIVIDKEVQEIKQELWNIVNKWYGQDVDLSKTNIIEYDLINQIERHYGASIGDTTEEKVLWIKNNVTVKS